MTIRLYEQDAYNYTKEKAELQMPIGDAMFKYMTVKGGDELCT